MRIALVGAGGQLGAAIFHELSPDHQITPLNHSALELTDPTAVNDAMSRVRPEVIVNCAAYNAVDAAEDHPIDALQVNAFAIRSLARAARTHGATLVHWSSDFVFDGTADRPYREDDAPNPRSVYAASKLFGEWFAADAPRAYVLRVESLFGRAPGGPPAKGSVAGIVNSLRAGGAPTVFGDRTVSPTYVIDAALATRHLLDRNVTPGLYHCVNSGHCTWAEFAAAAARQLDLEPRLTVVRMEDVQLRAVRPEYCALSNAKLASVGFVMPPWQDALSRYVRSIAEFDQPSPAI